MPLPVYRLAMLTTRRSLVEKNIFLEKLGKLVEVAKGKHNALDVTEINNFFIGDDICTQLISLCIIKLLDTLDQAKVSLLNQIQERGIDVIPVIDDSILAEEPLLMDDDIDDSFMKDSDEEDIDLDAIDLLEGIGTEDPVRPNSRVSLRCILDILLIVSTIFDEVLGTLTEREQKVLKLRFGLEDGRPRTLEEVGRESHICNLGLYSYKRSHHF